MHRAALPKLCAPKCGPTNGQNEEFFFFFFWPKVAPQWSCTESRERVGPGGRAWTGRGNAIFFACPDAPPPLCWKAERAPEPKQHPHQYSLPTNINTPHPLVTPCAKANSSPPNYSSELHQQDSLIPCLCPIPRPSVDEIPPSTAAGASPRTPAGGRPPPRPPPLGRAPDPIKAAHVPRRRRKVFASPSPLLEPGRLGTHAAAPARGMRKLVTGYRITVR